jgi:hypothetical protein
MKLLILNTDYPEFLNWLYTQHPRLEDGSYEEQMRARVESLNSEADFYSRNLRELGCAAYDIFANNEFMQRAWAREHGLRTHPPAHGEMSLRAILKKTGQMAAKTPLRYIKPLLRPLWRSLDGAPSWFYQILTAQVKQYRPDILFNQDMRISSKFLNEIKPFARLLVGQIASPLPPGEDFSSYDLVISSLPNYVDYFRRLGITTELNRLAFEPGVLSKLNDDRIDISVSFVGSLSRHHKCRVQLLESLCSQLDVKVWGPGVESLAKNSPIRQCYVGQAWGIEMYRVVRNSKITLNHHIGVSGPYANNMRLYEATGVGTLLVTDWKENLAEIFEPDREVVAYRSSQECAELIRHYLEDHARRETIARAGQQRTLNEHTYYHRTQRLVEILEQYMP